MGSPAMPAENNKPLHKPVPSEQRGYSTDPISLELARDVLRRVRMGELPVAPKNVKTDV